MPLGTIVKGRGRATAGGHLTNVYMGGLSKIFLRELGVVEQGVFPPIYVGAQGRLMTGDHSAHSAASLSRMTFGEPT